MSAHTLSRSTRTLEMIQVDELNGRLQASAPSSDSCLLVTAEWLGLGGAAIEHHLLDRAAATLVPLQERRTSTQPAVLPPAALLKQVVAAGAPSFPYLYGLFSEGGDGGRRYPVTLHTRHLTAISTLLQCRGHRWGL